MSYRIQRLLRLLIVLNIALPVYSQQTITKVGTTVAQFLSIGVGAGSMAMGGAAVASVNDATAIYWNPAGIANLNHGSVVLVHTQWLIQTNLNFLGVTLPLGRVGTFGFSATSLTMGDMKVRTVELPEGTGEYFTAEDIAFGVAYARKLTNFFSIGFHGKYIRQQIWHSSASSIAIDFGTMYLSDDGRIHLGASVSNFGSKMQFTGRDLRFEYNPNPEEQGDNEHIPAMLETSRWDLPLVFRVGVAVDLIQTSLVNFRMETDAVHPNDNSEQVNIGAEWQFLDLIAFRAGYQSLFVKDSEQGFTAGVGIQHKIGTVKLRVNYAYSNFGRLTYVNRFDIGLEF